MFGQKYRFLAVLNVFVKPECAQCSSLMMFFLAPRGTRILLQSSMITSVSPSLLRDSCVLMLSSWQMFEFSVCFDRLHDGVVIFVDNFLYVGQLVRLSDPLTLYSCVFSFVFLFFGLEYLCT